MSGIEYAVVVFATVLLVVAVAADNWNKRNNRWKNEYYLQYQV